MNRRDAIKRTSLLLGGALSASVITGVLNGCQPSLEPDWLPQILSPEQAALVEGVTERILPGTDTPGAKEVGVTEFIDLMLKDAFSEKEQAAFLTGVNSIEQQCVELNGRPFLKCKQEEQDELLKSMDASAYEGPEDMEPKPFFRQLKELTLLGYFTSERIMNEVLNFNPVPGAYQGCITVPPDEPLAVDLNV